ncbi:MAG: S41 family peptidase [Candidatus Sungbacteria bacterium]|nr:S41 family peptidase [Candidatus Sungbacteria bacterium]
MIVMELPPKQYQKPVIILFALALIGASFFAGVYYGFENRPGVEKVIQVLNQKPPQQFEEVDFNLFWDVWSRLEDKFVDKAKINREKLVYGAISGLVKSLGDPYTEFLPPPETKQFKEDVRGSFEGIGAEIGIRKGILTVIAPLKGSPAERAGIRAGDKIIKIDDTPSADLALDEAVRLIRGPKGTQVRLTIIHEKSDKSEEVKINRDTIRVQIIETAQKPDGVFVITLRSFTESAAFEFRKAVQEFFESGSKKLVFDLRNNPGGFLVTSVDVASWFIPPGEVVARERFADGSEEIYRSSGYRFLEQVPTVVLVNGGSASASEIVAGALRDIKGIQLVGTKTFGKGSVQEVVNLPKDSSLKVTIAKWLTPKGQEINSTGLEPDVAVELPEEPKKGEEDRDFILEKGIEVLKSL